MQRETAADARAALDGDLAAVRAGDLAHRRQAEPEPASAELEHSRPVQEEIAARSRERLRTTPRDAPPRSRRPCRATERRTPAASSSSPTVTVPPSGVNRTALVSRFHNAQANPFAVGLHSQRLLEAALLDHRNPARAEPCLEIAHGARHQVPQRERREAQRQCPRTEARRRVKLRDDARQPIAGAPGRLEPTVRRRRQSRLAEQLQAR